MELTVTPARMAGGRAGHAPVAKARSNRKNPEPRRRVLYPHAAMKLLLHKGRADAVRCSEGLRRGDLVRPASP